MEENLDDAIKELYYSTINLFKESYELLDIDLKKTENDIEWHNYMVNSPVQVGVGGGLMPNIDVGDINSFYSNSGGVLSFGLSKGMLEFICFSETSHKFGYTMGPKDLNGVDYHDAQGHRTFGYGLLYHPVTKQYMDTIKNSWSQSELELLYLYTAKIKSDKLKNWASKNNVKLSQNKFDAMISAMYNFDDGFLNYGVCKMIAENPDNPAIQNVWAHLSDHQASKYPGLPIRRAREAKIFMGS